MTKDELPRLADFLVAQRQDEEAFSRLVDEMTAYVESLDDDDIDIPTDHERAAEILTYVIDTLAAKPKATNDYIVVPQIDAENDFDNPATITIRCAPSLYHTEDLPRAREYRNVRFVRTAAEIRETTDGLPLVISWGFEFAPWSEVANYRVFVPENLSRKQVAQFAAELIWEVTFCGLTEERAQARSEEIVERIEKSVRDIDESTTCDDPESATSPFDSHITLDECIGEVEAEFYAAMDKLIEPITHDLWLAHVLLLADLADELGL